MINVYVEKCEKDIKRNMEIVIHSYTPRWLHSATQCIIQGCQSKKSAIDSVSKLLGLEVRPDTRTSIATSNLNSLGPESIWRVNYIPFFYVMHLKISQ